jgi:hypothetical protein
LTNIETIREFATKVFTNKGMKIGAPLVLDEISFVPIIKKEISREERDYLTLSEALEQRVCEVIDKGTEVAHILFKNTSDFPILIEEGEIFRGKGTQDRVSIGTVMVEPKTSVEVSVKCVHAPHHLSAGAAFGYGGKVSRGMLNEIRSMKYMNAMTDMPASSIDQSRVWSTVNEEMAAESVSDKSKYVKGVEKRRERAKKRVEAIKFPNNTIGIVAINPKGEIKGMEIHRTPHNFSIRKKGIFESLEANLSWKPEGKEPYQKAEEKVKELFEKLSNLEEGTDALKQVEIDGLVINKEGLHGEAFTTSFYSNVCPKCDSAKPRKKICPHCGFSEKDSHELTYMSIM